MVYEDENMQANFTAIETINTLAAIFEKHKKERVCVVGTTSVGKTTLLKQIPGCVDMDAEVFSQINDDEAVFIKSSGCMRRNKGNPYIEKPVSPNRTDICHSKYEKHLHKLT